MDLPICSNLGAQVPPTLLGVAALCGTLLDARVALDNVARVLVCDQVLTQYEIVCVDTLQVYFQIRTHVF